MLITRKQVRLKGYDYSQTNYYYITLCTDNRKEWFGSVENDEMVLNAYGQICLSSLQNLSDHYENISIDIFIIMPNHVHAILHLNNSIRAGYKPDGQVTNPPLRIIYIVRNHTRL